MDFRNIDRRGALGLLGAVLPGVFLSRRAEATPAPVTGAVVPEANKSTQTNPSDPFTAAAPSGLVGLAANAYRVVEAGPIERGAFQLRLADEQGDSFLVDVCAFDGAAGAARGPARTSYLELFLINSGHGGSRTHEGRGLAVMALATTLQHHEHVVPVARLLSLRERQQLFRHQLYAVSW